MIEWQMAVMLAVTAAHGVMLGWAWAEWTAKRRAAAARAAATAEQPQPLTGTTAVTAVTEEEAPVVQHDRPPYEPPRISPGATSCKTPDGPHIGQRVRVKATGRILNRRFLNRRFEMDPRCGCCVVYTVAIDGEGDGTLLCCACHLAALDDSPFSRYAESHQRQRQRLEEEFEEEQRYRNFRRSP